MKDNKHRSVILFSEWQRPLGALSLEQKGLILDALLAYPSGTQPDFSDPMLTMAWSFMEGGLAENERKWSETRLRRAEAGVKGNEKRWHDSEEYRKNRKCDVCDTSIANIAVSGSDSDSVSDSGSDFDSGSVSGSVSDTESGSDTVLPEPAEAESADAPLPPPGENGFSPPSEEEVRGYFADNGGTEAQADRFRAFYESNGWRVGQNPMRSWQAAAKVWLARDRERPQTAYGAASAAAPSAASAPKNKAFYATRPLAESRDFLKDAGLKRRGLRKG